MNINNKSKNRLKLLEPTEHLTDEQEYNERIVEEIARKYGLIYVEQSCIGGSESQYNDLLAAKDELSAYMQTGEVKRPFTLDDEVKWLFVFWT